MNTSTKESRCVSANFGIFLRFCRQLNGLTLSQLSTTTKISASYLNRMEQGSRKAPSLPILNLLAEGLEMDVNSLVAVALDSSGEPVDISAVIMGNDYTMDEQSATSGIKSRLMTLINLVISHDLAYITSSEGTSEIIEVAQDLRCTLDMEGIGIDTES